MAPILVSGGSGFLGSHLILRLLADGHSVRTTVRSAARENDVRALLKAGGAEPGDRLTFAHADLTNDAGWAAAVNGCEVVHHVASPFPPSVPKNPDELIVPAREGSLRVLRAARDAGVKRVVLTSSFAAIGYGHPEQAAPFDEKTWTNLDSSDVPPYPRSKTLAERAAWDFIAREGGSLELTTVNPVGIFGPVLAPDTSTSILIIHRLLDGSLPALPRIIFGGVDVRDVADLHVRAAAHPNAKGERFLAVAGRFVSMHELSMMLRARLGERARRAPTRQLPSWLVRVGALFDKEIRQILPELDRKKDATSAKAERLLGWAPRSVEDAAVATAESLYALGILKSR